MKKNILVLFLMSVLISSCTSAKNIEHPKDIPVDDVNYSIQIVAPRAWNTFRQNEPISLLITNSTDNNIFFYQDFGQRIFIIQNDTLSEVENKMININANIIGNTETTSDTITLAPHESAGLTVKIDAANNKGTSVRVYITGKLEDTSKTVTAFIDILLNP